MRPASPAPGALAAECRVFCRYLANLESTEYILRCYERAWDSAGSRAAATPLIDRALLATARWGSVPARIADAYAKRFRPYSPLRRRLILVLAILENSPSAHEWLNSARTGSVPGLMAGMALSLFASGLCLLAGILLFGPLHVASLSAGRPR